MKRGSFLPQGLRVVGDLEGKEDLLLAGSIEGDVDLEGELTISASGVVRGELRAAGVVVQGVVIGNVVAEHYVRIDAGGRVVGDVRAPRIHLVEGGLLRGRLQMTGEGRLPMPALTRSLPKDGRRPLAVATAETLAGQSSVGFVPAPDVAPLRQSETRTVAAKPPAQVSAASTIAAPLAGPPSSPKATSPTAVSKTVAPATIPPVVGPAASSALSKTIAEAPRHAEAPSIPRHAEAPSIPRLGRAQVRRRAENNTGGQRQ